MLDKDTRIHINNVNFFYGNTQALKDITMPIAKNKVTAIIGPSGCGKSTLIRLLNRMNDLIPKTQLQGEVLLDGKNIYEPCRDVVDTRRKIGMVFQKPNPFPKSIFDNLAYGLRVNGMKNKNAIRERVRDTLERSALWEEVKDRLYDSALTLSGGQQQRLCIARCIAIKPEVILFDEPCASLDPTSTKKIEKLIEALKKQYTIVIVTHNMQQAARVSDYTAFLYLGKLVEFAETDKLFTTPAQKLTDDYLNGRFG
jgi:phosphate transport system ATP-binding protein